MGSFSDIVLTMFKSIDLIQKENKLYQEKTMLFALLKKFNEKQKIAFFWTIFVFISIILFFLLTRPSYQKIDAVYIWILSCVGILYLAQKPDAPLDHNGGKKVIILGIFVTIFSFANIPLGFGNPPYSIGDFSIFLAGIGLILFGVFRIRSYILPIALPLIAIIGFQVYDHFLRNEDLIAAPLIPPVVLITQFLLHTVGIPAKVAGNMIWFNSLPGAPIYLSIVSDCTGIWSLGTFTIATLIVITSFPEAKSWQGSFLILIGYMGTYVANLMRVFIIALSGYFFGPVGVIEQTHIHIGWIVFTLWMAIFWYYFFINFLGISINPLKKE